MKHKLLIAVVVLLAPYATALAQNKLKAIKAGKLIDVLGGTVLSNQVILIDSNTIIAMGPGLIIPKDAQVIDLSNCTVLPGLMDCHTHLTAKPSSDYYADIFRKTPIDYK